MLRALTIHVPRVLLVVMLATFLTPSFAWQTIATHDEIAHTLAHHSAAQQTGHAAGDADDHDEDAHGAIGHLLGHLPAFHSASLAIPQIAPAASGFADRVTLWSPISPEPPLRPPRFG